MKKTLFITLELDQSRPASAVYQAVHALANSIQGELYFEADQSLRIRQPRLPAGEG